MLKIQQLNPPPREERPTAHTSVIDAEVVAEEGVTLQLRAGPPEEAAPALFSLPAELDPKSQVALQRMRLDQMVASLEGREIPGAESGASGPDPTTPPDTPEAFLGRAMALLDGHLEAMEGTLDRIVGRRWTRNEDS